METTKSFFSSVSFIFCLAEKVLKSQAFGVHLRWEIILSLLPLSNYESQMVEVLKVLKWGQLQKNEMKPYRPLEDKSVN